MPDAELEWHGDEALAMIRARVVRCLHRAAIAVKNRAKELLSVAGTGRVDGKTARNAKGHFKATVTRSKPGEPPRKQTGLLRSKVAHEVDEATLTARVGTNLEYGRHLELGTKRGLAPRPWLRRALAEVAARVEQLLDGLGEP
ncbi:hypothetical protein [Paludisphaera mucosa]|uniref:HK97 gp10 family phage protein n=1 Tax=Paludisphaera mucosa TaxID=3030827 RepID=A0ABT6F6P4_9BACT|nr:hypothetical protein [Paludisphaera mucosa]MDG3003245.1 hypothetical protein [Paludisphaera mucosa]